ncbi:MAG: serine hydrolase domain-containing protein [Bacteroidota bacterium]
MPNAPDTKFRIASTTKQFTAALVHRLAEAGRIDLDAPISTVLPDYPTPQGTRIPPRTSSTRTSPRPLARRRVGPRAGSADEPSVRTSPMSAGRDARASAFS